MDMSDHAHKHESNRQHPGLRPGDTQDHDHEHDEEIRLGPENAKQGRSRPNMLIVLASSLTLAALAGLGIFLIYL